MVEVLVALALTVMLLAAILLVVRAEIGLSTAVRESGRGWETGRSLATMINLQVASAANPKGGKTPPLEGDSRQVTFLTTISRSGPAPQGKGIVEVSYRWDEKGTFHYRERLIPLPGITPPAEDPGEPGDEEELTALLAEFALRYIDKEGGEHDVWPLPDEQELTLPAAVLVTVRPAGLRDPLLLVARVNR
jgi:hypothetical protein